MEYSQNNEGDVKFKEELRKIFWDYGFLMDRNFLEYLTKTLSKYESKAKNKMLLSRAQSSFLSEFPPVRIVGEVFLIDTDLFDESILERIIREALINELIFYLEIFKL